MSFSRVSTANRYDTTVAQINQRQSDVSNSQLRLSAEKRVLKASDDPAAAAQAERERTRLQRVQSDQRAIEASRRSLELAEGTLGNVNDLYLRAQELIVQAGNGALSLSNRESIANELEGLRESVLRLANARDAQGRPLFMGLGLQSGTQPFVESSVVPSTNPLYGGDGRAVDWQGMAGQAAPSENSLPVVLDGLEIFGQSPPNSAVGGNSVWEAFDRAIYALRDPGMSAADYQTNLQQVNENLAQRLDALLIARGSLGNWLNRADAMTAQLQEREVYHQTKESELTDLDMVKGISEFQTQQLGLQAALQSYAQVQKLSLFQYIA